MAFDDGVVSNSNFDNLMIHTCDVLEKGQSAPDARSGQPTATLKQLVSGVPCRLTTLKRGGGEWQSNKKYALNDFVIFLRPIFVDDIGGKFELSSRHWLRVYTKLTVYLVNLKNVNDPSGLGHHLECRGEQIVT